MTPRATYRMQLHAGFTFADAQAQVPYLAQLGISHLYASPITTAAPGSTHGYDVVDPTRVNPELGGEAGLHRLVAALRAHAMGLVIDIVPNHMGVAGDTNAWWLDVLRHGRESRYAPVFDIDWPEPASAPASAPAGAQIVLPVLGAALDQVIAQGDLRQDGDAVLLYGKVRYPLRPDSARGGDLRALLARQHYRLAYWRTGNDTLNWRRFFAINELAGVRIEDPAVFELTHRLYFDLFAQGLIDGVRVDHVDGLTDPGGYCRALRHGLTAAGSGREPWIVVEKILAREERLAPDWQVEGTSGYDFMREVSELLHVAEGFAPLRSLWVRISGAPRSYASEVMAARQDMLAWQLEGQLAACTQAFAALAAAEQQGWLTAGMLRRAIERLLWVFPVYRTYGDGAAAPAADAQWRARAAAQAKRYVAPGEDGVIDRVCGWLAGDAKAHPALAAEAVRRFQQLSAPVAAKGVEDTAFYRYGALLSTCDVGFDPAQPTMTIEAFHATMAERAATLPHALLATATHDHKRGEDARARLAVLSAIPEAWAAEAGDWLIASASVAPEIDPTDTYQLFQTLVGSWRPPLHDLLPRIHRWQVKALREAQLRSSWSAPDETYEAHYQDLATRLLTGPDARLFVPRLERFLERIGPAARANALAQVALRHLVPGVPDLYQGCELAEFSMVDPDNRRPVDFGRRRDLLERDPAQGGSPKLALIARLLTLRREHPLLFQRGDYRPLAVEGPRRDHVIAFARRHQDVTVCCAIAIRLGAPLFASGTQVPVHGWWEGTAVTLAADTVLAADLFAHATVHVSVD